MTQHILCVGLIHINSTYIVVLVDIAEITLELQIANVTTIVVVTLRITMTHESNDTISDGCLDIALVIQRGSECLGIALFSHQRSTYYHLTIDALHILIGEVAITVVHEVLYIAVANTTILLTRNHLK